MGPGPFYTTDDLVAIPQGWFDLDGDPEAYRYQWTINDETRAGVTEAVLVAHHTAEGDRVFVTAYPFDGQREGAGVTSEVVAIEATQASVLGVDLLSVLGANGLTRLYGQAMLDNPDARPVVLQWRWSVNGETVAGATDRILRVPHGKRGDVVRVHVRGRSGQQFGAEVTSGALLLGNAPPVIHRLALQPAGSVSGDLLWVDVDASDSDGDPVQLSYSWRRNGVAQAWPSSQTSVASVLVEAGDRWEVVVQAGDAYGAAVTAFVRRTIRPAYDWQSVGLGTEHACALRNDGAVMCWGWNWEGQIFPGGAYVYREPVTIPGLPGDVVELGVGERHNCVRTGAGEIWCWGSNVDDQLRPVTSGTSSLPRPVTGFSALPVALAVGGAHACVRTAAGGVECWGDNIDGQLGNGTFGGRPAEVVAVTGLASGVQDLAAGYYHNCAHMEDGSLRCWGYNEQGQLGLGDVLSRATPETVPGLPGNLALVRLGVVHSCVTDSAGALYCWGDDSYGALGIAEPAGGPVFVPTPVPLAGTGILDLALGVWHSCVADAGGVRCWGRGHHGQIGDEGVVLQRTPMRVAAAPPGVVQLTAGLRDTCARVPGRPLLCWGGLKRSLATGPVHPPQETGPHPQPLDGLVLSGYGSCSWSTNGKAHCWASPLVQHARGPTVATAFPAPVSMVATGGQHQCMLDTSGGVWCWGNNFWGQLGNGRQDDGSWNVFEKVDLPDRATRLALGERHSCALLRDGRVMCWGDTYAKWGHSPVAGELLVPAVVDGLGEGVAEIAAGSFDSCALMRNGSVRCWGASIFGSGVETKWPGVPLRAVALALANWGDDCAVIEDGSVRCWEPSSSSVPEPLAGLPAPAVDARVQLYSICLLLADSSVACMGENTQGILGDGTTEFRSEPVRVSNLSSGVRELARGQLGCALTVDKRVVCWGSPHNLASGIPVAAPSWGP